MKQNITLAIDKQLLKRARAFAAQRGTSVSAMLAEELRTMVERETAYERAMAGALALLESPWDLGGGARTWTREDLYDRKGLR
jgi:hypothetical protein